MAKRKTELEKLGLDAKTLDKLYVKAKISASPYDYSLKDRVVLEPSGLTYEAVTNMFNQGDVGELELVEKLGMACSDLANDELRASVYLLRSKKPFPNLDWDNDYNATDALRNLMCSNTGIMYKHNNMIINESAYACIAKNHGVKAASALLGLYVRLYSPTSLTPQLALALLKSTDGLDLDAVSNIAFVKEAMDRGEHYVPDTGLMELRGQTLAQIFYMGSVDLDDPTSNAFLGKPNLCHAYSEILRQNVIETTMFLCEIYRAFNSMSIPEREALAPLLVLESSYAFLDLKYDVDSATYTSAEFDAISKLPAEERFEAIPKYAEEQLRKNFPQAYAWDGNSVLGYFNSCNVQKSIIARICHDLHCKAWEDFRVKNFALLLQMCKEKGVDLSDMEAPMDYDGSSCGVDADDGGSPVDAATRDFGSMHMGTKYSPDAQNAPGNPGGKSQIGTPPQLETMSNLLKTCDPKYDILVDDVYNDRGYKDAYLKLLDPIESITKALTKQIREIKTYNFGGKNAGKPRGKLDPHTMCRYKTDPNIFYDTTYKVREMDLAFGIILDQSGSMSGDGICNGMISLIMLHHVLASLRINHAIVGHNSHNYNSANIFKYVSFNEDPAHTMETPYILANLHASCGNCDSGALNYMEHYIKRTRNKDRIVLIFSDGEPSECDESDLVKQVRKMEAEGIHVIGLGIDFENIKHYYPDHANGRNLSEMVSILVSILKRYVLDKRD